MALAYDGAIQRLIDAFGRLPGIGPKGAQRIAFYMLSAPEDEARDLAEAIEEVKAKIRFCDICGNVCESSPCPVCADPRRDRSVICVVEEPKDVMSIEAHARIPRPIPCARRRNQPNGQRWPCRPAYSRSAQTLRRR